MILRRLVFRLALGAMLVALAGCASRAVITASSTYRDQMADVFTALDELTGAHTDVWRQRRVLQWKGSPKDIAGAAGFDLKMLGGKGESDALAVFVCAPAGEEKRFAADVTSDYMQGLANVSKAPGEGLVAITRAISAEQKKLGALGGESKAAFPGEYVAQFLRCGSRVLDLYGTSFKVTLEPSSPVEEVSKSFSLAGGGAPLDLLTSVYDALLATAQLVEQEKRAELIEAHVLANCRRIEQAQAILSAKLEPEPKTICRADATFPLPKSLLGPTLAAELEDRMRFHLTVALVNVATAHSASTAAARQEAAERAARHIALYRTLARVSVEDDLLKPMRDANAKFVALIDNPRGNFDDFMDAVAKLRATRDKWVDVRDKYRAWRD